MTDPIGTAQERELIDWLHELGFEYSRAEEAADALQSRIAEVGRLTEGKLFAKRQWAQEAERAERLENENRRLSDEMREIGAVIRSAALDALRQFPETEEAIFPAVASATHAALSLQRRV